VTSNKLFHLIVYSFIVTLNCTAKIIKYCDKIQSNITLLISFLRIYSDVVRLFEAIFRINLSVYIHILQCGIHFMYIYV